MTIPLITGSPVVQARMTARLRATRAAFRAMEVLAPGLGARRAAHLWCTIPRGGRRRDLRPHPGRVERLPLPGGRQVVVESWGDGRPVYLVHGWGGWRGQLGAMVSPLLAAGLRPVAFDAPGHGESPPGLLGAGSSTLPEMIEALDAVTAVYGDGAGVIAHSLGTSSAGCLMASRRAADTMVLIAPNGDIGSHDVTFAGMLGFGERTRMRLRQRMEAVAGAPLDSFNLTAAGADGRFADALVVHDLRDKESDHANGERLAMAWSAELTTTDGLGHRRILADPAVVAAAVGHVVAGRG